MGNHRIVKQHKDGRRAETTRERERERERERGGENKNTRTWSAHERGNPSWQALGFPKHQRDCVPRSGKGFHYPGWARTVIPSSYAFLPLDGVSSFSPLCSHRPSSTPVLPPPPNTLCPTPVGDLHQPLSPTRLRNAPIRDFKWGVCDNISVFNIIANDKWISSRCNNTNLCHPNVVMTNHISEGNTTFLWLVIPNELSKS